MSPSHWGELKWVILCVALFLIESTPKWLRQWNYPCFRCLVEYSVTEKGRKARKEGVRETNRGRRDEGMEEGKEMTETNASALTAVLHFLTDRHTNEDHKSKESL